MGEKPTAKKKIFLSCRVMKGGGSRAMQDEYLDFWSFTIFLSSIDQAFIKKEFGKTKF